MMRTAFRPLAVLFGLSLALGACSSGTSQSDLVSEYLAPPGSTDPDPAFIAARNAGAPALVAALQSKDNAYSLFVQQTENAKGEETWISFDKLSLGLKDGMIIATRGFGYDQLAGDADQTLAALKAGRETITERFVTMLTGESQAETLAFRCQITAQSQQDIKLSDTYISSTDLFNETCRNGLIEFRNFFWVERGSRDIVQSRQWISEETGALALRSVKS